MIADIKKIAEQKMKKSLESLKMDLAKVRTGGLLRHTDGDSGCGQRDVDRRAHHRCHAVGKKDD